MFTRPGEASGCFTNTVVINSFTLFLPLLFAPPTQTVNNLAFKHEVDYVAQVWDIINLKVYQNCITALHYICSKVIVIFLSGWILPIGQVASKRVCVERGYPA